MSDHLSPIPWLDVALIVALIALNGVFAMSELAIVSSREARLKAMVKAGSGGARRALELAAEPGRFLSTVQIGITLIGILAGAFSGSRLGGPVSERIAAMGVERELSQSLGFGTVIVLTTYLSLVIGELVPKQFALRSPESIAAVVARPMSWLARATAPFVWLLDQTSSAIFRLLRLDRESKNHVTAEELHLVVAEAQTAGVLEESERAIISGIVRLADRPVREVMTPRTEVDWIDLNASAEEIRSTFLESGHSRLPVADGSIDNIVGVIQTRDVLAAKLRRKAIDIKALSLKPPVIPELMDAMDALAVLRAADVPLALVHDEYGHLEGIVTPGSLLAALAGTFAHDIEIGEKPPLTEREDGSFLLSGAASADILIDRLGMNLPQDREFATVAGFALSVLKHIPECGERFVHDRWTFEIVDLEGRKIDKLIAFPPKRKKRETAEESGG